MKNISWILSALVAFTAVPALAGQAQVENVARVLVTHSTLAPSKKFVAYGQVVQIMDHAGLAEKATNTEVFEGLKANTEAQDQVSDTLDYHGCHNDQYPGCDLGDVFAEGLLAGELGI